MTHQCVVISAVAPAVSIQTELALEQLQQKHQQELKELHIQLETQVTVIAVWVGGAAQRPCDTSLSGPRQLRRPLQVNYYERSLELMRQSMEVERKDISQAFKVSRPTLAVSINCCCDQWLSDYSISWSTKQSTLQQPPLASISMFTISY